MYDLLVIGGGPGGVAAAAYGLHLGLKTVLIAPDLGGKVNYPFSIKGLLNVETVHGARLVRTFASKIGPTAYLAQTVSAVEEVEGGFKATLGDGSSCEGQTIVLSTGAKPRRLYVPGEDKLWTRGLSYSAISHAPLFAGRDVAVIGDDHRAQVAALELCRIAHHVSFITPNPKRLDDKLMQRILAHGNADVFTGWEVISVEGGEFLTGITLQGRTGVIREVTLDGVFVELGLIPNSDFVAHLVERDEEGHIKVDQNNRTSHPAIFAAGDVTNVYVEQVPIALGDGIKAALGASEYLVRHSR